MPLHACLRHLLARAILRLMPVGCLRAGLIVLGLLVPSLVRAHEWQFSIPTAEGRADGKQASH